MNIENAKAQMRKGILEYCILSILGKKDLYTSDIIVALKENDLIVVEGTLYPLLTGRKMPVYLTTGGKKAPRVRHANTIV